MPPRRKLANSPLGGHQPVLRFGGAGPRVRRRICYRLGPGRRTGVHGTVRHRHCRDLLRLFVETPLGVLPAFGVLGGPRRTLRRRHAGRHCFHQENSRRECFLGLRGRDPRKKAGLDRGRGRSNVKGLSNRSSTRFGRTPFGTSRNESFTLTQDLWAGKTPHNGTSPTTLICRYISSLAGFRSCSSRCRRIHTERFGCSETHRPAECSMTSVPHGRTMREYRGTRDRLGRWASSAEWPWRSYPDEADRVLRQDWLRASGHLRPRSGQPALWDRRTQAGARTPGREPLDLAGIITHKGTATNPEMLRKLREQYDFLGKDSTGEYLSIRRFSTDEGDGPRETARAIASDMMDLLEQKAE